MPEVVSDAILHDHDAPHGSWNRKYDWSAWADGKSRLFRQGEDYYVDPLAFVSAARMWGKRTGLRVISRVINNDVVLKFVPRPAPDAQDDPA